MIGTPVRGCTLLPMTPSNPDPQPGLIERLMYCGVLRRLAGLDLPTRERPWRVPVPALADQHAEAQVTTARATAPGLSGRPGLVIADLAHLAAAVLPPRIPPVCPPHQWIRARHEPGGHIVALETDPAVPRRQDPGHGSLSSLLVLSETPRTSEARSTREGGPPGCAGNSIRVRAYGLGIRLMPS